MKKLKLSAPTVLKTAVVSHREVQSGTTAVLKQGIPDVLSMPRMYITFVSGTPRVGTKLLVCLAAVYILYF